MKNDIHRKGAVFVESIPGKAFQGKIFGVRAIVCVGQRLNKKNVDRRTHQR
jgi:hypothetical protein